MTQTTDREETPRGPDRGGRRARREPLTHRGLVLRGLIIGLVVVLLGVGIFVLGRSLTTAEPARVTVDVKVPSGGVMPGERFDITGTTSTSFGRPVYLEAEVGGAWSRLESGQTGSAGGFRFQGVRTQRAERFRIVLPAIRNVGQSHPAVTHAVPTLRVVPQQVADFSVLPGIAQPGAAAAEASEARLAGEAAFTPIRPGRRVLVQRRGPGGSWEVVARATQGAEGKVRFQVPQDVGTPYQFRVVAQPYRGAPLMASKAQASNRWRLDFDEQFALGVDPDLWITRQPEHSPESSRTCAKADEDMVTFEGGVVALSVAPDPAFAPDSCEWNNPASGAGGTEDYYLNSHIGTQGGYSFRYGVAAARVKFQQAEGMHGAFWLQDSGELEGTLGAEIDTAEFFGRGFRDGTVASFVYPAGMEEVGGTQPDAERALTGPRDTWWDRYHVFSVEWTPQEYVFRVDGVETLRVDKNVADRKVFVILSLLTSDWELKNIPEAGSGTMHVDWVRVWQDTRLAEHNL